MEMQQNPVNGITQDPSFHGSVSHDGEQVEQQVRADLRQRGWSASVDRASGLVYLFNSQSGESRWADGTELEYSQSLPYSVPYSFIQSERQVPARKALWRSTTSLV